MTMAIASIEVRVLWGYLAVCVLLWYAIILCWHVFLVMAQFWSWGTLLDIVSPEVIEGFVAPVFVETSLFWALVISTAKLDLLTLELHLTRLVTVPNTKGYSRRAWILGLTKVSVLGEIIIVFHNVGKVLLWSNHSFFWVVLYLVIFWWALKV